MRWVATDATTFDLVPYGAPEPSDDEVTIAVRAAGVNPADVKHPARATSFPVPIGYEVAGVVSAAGSSSGFAVGDEVLAFRISGGWASSVTVPARDVFTKPASLTFPEAANLLLAGCTAADLLHTAGVAAGDTVLVHGASGAVGVSLLQQAAELGVHVVGTASPARFEVVERFGGTPVEYGPGLRERLASYSFAAALDCIGTDEAVDVSLALVPDRSRIVTIAAPARAAQEGFPSLGGTQPASKEYRDSVRASLVSLAASNRLVVPIARTFPLVDALAAVDLIRSRHPGGKLALIP
ncbi:MAG TPA: NADP-dependent oxidoreductase [Nocardioides sp.]|nr:NADP-dependent oxidoreductase [Nocardioides sp.]